MGNKRDANAATSIIIYRNLPTECLEASILFEDRPTNINEDTRSISKAILYKGNRSSTLNLHVLA